jgi:hypothetical protein
MTTILQVAIQIPGNQFGYISCTIADNRNSMRIQFLDSAIAYTSGNH